MKLLTKYVCCMFMEGFSWVHKVIFEFCGGLERCRLGGTLFSVGLDAVFGFQINNLIF